MVRSRDNAILVRHFNFAFSTESGRWGKLNTWGWKICESGTSVEPQPFVKKLGRFCLNLLDLCVANIIDSNVEE